MSFAGSLLCSAKRKVALRGGRASRDNRIDRASMAAFFWPTYGTVVAAIQFDQTGATRMGKPVLNHRFMVPGLVTTISAISIGFGLVAP